MFAQNELGPAKAGVASTEDSPIPGSAEYVVTRLSGVELACPHFPKYRAHDVRHQQRYPSRLAFFHASSAETITSYLDTGKLCIQCLDETVPDGFNYWSTPTPSRPPGDTGTITTENTSENAGALPLSLFRAGTEDFHHSQARSESTSVSGHHMTAPVSIRVPGGDGAKEVWRWLKTKSKPFYVNQLHLTEGWSPQAQLAADWDSTIAEKIGTPFVTALPRIKRKERNAIPSSSPKPDPKLTSTRKAQESRTKKEVSDTREEGRELKKMVHNDEKVGSSLLFSGKFELTLGLTDTTMGASPTPSALDVAPANALAVSRKRYAGKDYLWTKNEKRPEREDNVYQ